MVTALASLLSDTPVKSTVGMTGEVTLQGRVLPIGGLKQKVLAAHRAGLKEVILPKRNEGDLDDVPEQVREEIAFHPVETVDEVLSFALERRCGGGGRQPRLSSMRSRSSERAAEPAARSSSRRPNTVTRWWPSSETPPRSTSRPSGWTSTRETRAMSNSSPGRSARATR
jgi:predicted ATP-dependent protease